MKDIQRIQVTFFLHKIFTYDYDEEKALNM